MKIGIFGCTADPFTEAHAAIVGKVLSQNLVDHVIIAPTIVDWHREGKIPWLSDDQKCELINFMLLNDPSIKKLPPRKIGYWDIWDKDFKLREVCKLSSALEEKYVKSHRFIDTLVDIIQCREWNFIGDKKDNEYYVILGTDSYLNFKTWGMWQEILKLAKLIVVDGRNGLQLPSDEELPCTKISIDERYASVSASEIRQEWLGKGYEAYKKWLEGKLMWENAGKTEKLLHTPIFDVVRGEETSTGLKPILIDAPDWVTIIAEKNKEFLTVKQFRYGARCDVEEFPSGMVEKDEDPKDATMRELEEETGIKLLSRDSLVKLGSTNPNPAFMLNTMHYFYVNLDQAEHDVTEQHLDEHEQIAFAWKSKSCFMFDVLDDAHSGKQVPAIALAAMKLYEHASTYPGCG